MCGWGSAHGTGRFNAALCSKLGVTQSKGAVGSSAENALAESFNAALKREVLQEATTRPDELTCPRKAFKWLTRYNTKHRHTRCRHNTPIAYETDDATATLQPAT